MLEMIVVEQFLNTLPSNTRIWVTERKPKTVAEAGRLADDYIQARGQKDEGQDGSGNTGVAG